MLVVGMPTTPGQKDIGFVKAELNTIRDLIPSCTALENPKKTEVLSMIPTHQLTHFSCHGYSSPTDPSQSRLLLDDWNAAPLTVSDLTRLNAELPQLAYLSACHTANIADIRLLDESINLTSAFQLAGYPSVLGSLWQVTDEHAPEIARIVYSWMLMDGKLDTLRSAEALHQAVHVLRRKTSSIPGFTKTVSNLLIWAPYVHIGV
jgi:CHAT domain-containing protein